MTDVYKDWGDQKFWDELVERRKRWVEEGLKAEIFPPDCELASQESVGALPYGKIDDGDGKLRVMFLHGLESSAVGVKSLYLARWFRVCAPSMIPKRPFLTMNRVCAAIHAFRPHVIVGSSFGGAVLLSLLQHGEWSGPSILLAPALGLLAPYSLSLPAGLSAPIILVHGSRDTLVPPSHSRALYDSVSNDSKIIIDCSGKDHKETAAEVLSRVVSSQLSLLITDDDHPLKKLCCEDSESASVPTLRMLVEGVCQKTKDADGNGWCPAVESSGYLTALSVCATILWQFPTHAIARRCCPRDKDNDQFDLSRVGAEASAMEQSEMAKKQQ